MGLGRTFLNKEASRIRVNLNLILPLDSSGNQVLEG